MSDAATSRSRGRLFTYTGFELTASGILTCTYDLDDERFEERFVFETTDDADFTTPAAQAAARLLFLLAGVSYYKTGAPPRITGPADGLTRREQEFLADFYRHGLAEFAWRPSGRDVSDLVIESEPRTAQPATYEPALGPLVPFGGGIDSIVVVDGTTAAFDDVALFVANTSDVPFQPIEDSAAITGLPMRRVRRHLDPKVLASRERGYYNGHVPVTGVLSAAAVLCAVAHGHDRVIMSNEHSASEPTGLRANEVPVNHQWSKSLEFEQAFRAVLAESVAGVDYSALRAFSELWVASRFAELTDYHLAFQSCNKGFYVDAGSRLKTWCGRCDKCCFIDLILSPYLAPEALDAIFRGHEPLADESLEPVFQSLLGQPGTDKPLECVGDEGECRTATLLAAARPDRADNALLARLAAHVQALGKPVPTAEVLLHKQGPDFLPADDLR